MAAAKQLSEEEAIAFYDDKKWEPMTLRERAEFQVEQDRLCMPFDVFHAAIEHALGRPVWTHEFAERDRIRDELAGRRPKGTVAESFAALERLMPGKPVIVIDGSAS